MKPLLYCLFFFVLAQLIAAAPPEWITSIPYEKDSFLGVGSGKSTAEAEENARIDILIQLSSKIDSTVTYSGNLSATEQDVVELCKTVITSNTLRGAEIVETYRTDEAVYVLMRYCDSCGSILVSATLRSAVDAVTKQRRDEAGEEPMDMDVTKVIADINSQASSDAAKIKRKLSGPPIPQIEPSSAAETDDANALSIKAEKYKSENILVSINEEEVVVRLINFLPNRGEMTEQQIYELTALCSTLFLQLEEMGYKGVTIVGHANPEGSENEEEELESLSRERALTMEEFLKDSGIKIDSVKWMGGDFLLGSVDTMEGRGLNRRVDIHVHF